MKKQIFHLFLATAITVIYSACDFLKESESEEEQAAGFTNTLNKNLGVPKALSQNIFTILKMM